MLGGVFPLGIGEERQPHYTGLSPASGKNIRQMVTVEHVHVHEGGQPSSGTPRESVMCPVEEVKIERTPMKQKSLSLVKSQTVCSIYSHPPYICLTDARAHARAILLLGFRPRVTDSVFVREVSLSRNSHRSSPEMRNCFVHCGPAQDGEATFGKAKRLPDAAELASNTGHAVLGKGPHDELRVSGAVAPRLQTGDRFGVENRASEGSVLGLFDAHHPEAKLEVSPAKPSQFSRTDFAAKHDPRSIVQIAIVGLIPCRVQQGSNLFKREDDVASGFRPLKRKIVRVHFSSSSATCAVSTSAGRFGVHSWAAAFATQALPDEGSES
jgi:hypothetical protein